MKLQLKEDPREWRKFTLTACVGLSIPALLLTWQQWLPTVGLGVWLSLLAALALTCLLRPAWFRGFYRGGMRFGHAVSQGLGFVLLSLFFCLLVTPLGWALRLAGKDLLHLRRSAGTRSFWHNARTHGDLEKMF